MTESRRPLLLSTSGYATTYLVIPPGTFAAEYQHVKNVLGRNAKHDPDHRNPILSVEPEVLYLLGQARFAARVQTRDFRYVLDRSYPDRESMALVSNAVFSIPYERSDDSTPEHAKTDPGMLRFITHLRARRTVYAKQPIVAEALMVERLRELSDRLKGEVSVEVGLGWADFIVSGVIPPSKFDDFLTLLIDFNGVRIDPEIGEPGCVFKRSLTLLGYAWTGKHQHPAIDERFKMFIRVRPGALAEVDRLLKDKDTFSHTLFDPPDVEFVDGKIDIIASVHAKSKFFEEHERLSEETGRLLIEKFETHVVFSPAHLKKSEVEDGESSIARDCGCAVSSKPPHYVVDEAVPDNLAQAIKNMQFLFSTTLHDLANCCDGRSAIVACEESLQRLLKILVLKKVEMNLSLDRLEKGPDQEDEVLRSNQTVVDTLERIERWVRAAERTLRQRSVGSFEEFLGQSDRAVVYRGGAQKILLVADHLMNDFYAKIVSLDTPAPFLSAVYDSSHRIQHVVGTGFVRVPVRSLFFLPGSVPELWHEAGVYHFFENVLPSQLNVDLFLPMEGELYGDFADHYGDLISFLYGFRLEFEQFASALFGGWIASQAYANVPDLARQWSFEQILGRLVAVLEFLYRSDLKPEDDRENWLVVLYEEVCDAVIRHNDTRLPKPTELTRDRVIDNLLSEPLASGLLVLRSLLDSEDVADARSALAVRPIDKTVVRFDQPEPLQEYNDNTDFNEEFRKLYWAVERERRLKGSRPNAFAVTAALTRGALLEYHRRTTLTR